MLKNETSLGRNNGVIGMTEAKFASFTTCDFLNDVDLDIFIDAIEKSASIWVKGMKRRGLLCRSLNGVWNQNDVHRLVMSYEYESKTAYLKIREYIEKAFEKLTHFKKYVPLQNLQPLDV